MARDIENRLRTIGRHVRKLRADPALSFETMRLVAFDIDWDGLTAVFDIIETDLPVAHPYRDVALRDLTNLTAERSYFPLYFILEKAKGV